jgi:glucose-6-phosphate isomerase
MAVSLDREFLWGFVSQQELSDAEASANRARETLLGGAGAGREFLGWLYPEMLADAALRGRILACAEDLREHSDTVLVVGIGGSYLGAQAAIDYLVSPLYNHLDKKTPDIWFIGTDLSTARLREVLNLCVGRRVSVIVISKSGTTLEPAAAFHLIKSNLPAGQIARVVAVTDRACGTLRKMADEQGYESFVIPENVGGRYSVLTAVGLVPIAAAGIDIAALQKGAADAAKELQTAPFENNPCLQYAAARYLLYQKGRAVELFCGWDPCWAMTAEWLKQLFGESEGKQGRGLFPASALYPTQLHSRGQFVQEGSPVLFETMLHVDKDNEPLVLEARPGDADGLEYLLGMSLSEINRRAVRAVALAHASAHTPCLLLTTPSRTAYEYGWLLYFFELACAVGGYMLGVNPFDQPGVEAYKKNLAALLH